MTILDAVKDGPRSYRDLPQSPDLDFQLARLLREKKIERYIDPRVADVCMFGLPRPPDKDEEKRVSRAYDPRKTITLKNGRREKRIKRPTCPKCKGRKMYPAFEYNGRLNLYCFDCYRSEATT